MLNKRHLIWLGIAVLCLCVIFVGGWFFVSWNDDAIKEKLQTGLSSALQLDVKISGAVEFAFYPPGLAVSDLGIWDGDLERLTVKRTRVGIALWPLLWGEMHVSKLSLSEPQILLPFKKKSEQQTTAQTDPTGLLKIDRIKFIKASIRWQSDDGGAEQGKIRSVATGLDLDIDDFTRTKDGKISYSGTLRSGQLDTGKLRLTNLQAKLLSDGEEFRFDSINTNLYGAPVLGQLVIDISGDQPSWRSELKAQALPMTELSTALAGSRLFSGNIQLAADLSGNWSGNFLKTLEGSIEISGSELTQYGFDLDQSIIQFRDSRDIDLLDIGLYAFLGPFGALIGKGVDVTSLAWTASQSDQQQIAKLVFNWSLNEGVAKTEDVAFRTKENRLAFSGSINLAKEQYKGLTLGLLNADGCAELSEKITGSFSDPEIKKISLLGTLTESLLGIFQQSWEIIDPRDCETFYSGSVEAPSGGKQRNILSF